jgi:hypothetical protein
MFQFPLEIQVDGALTKQIAITDRETRVSIPYTKKPATVILDPQINLLFEGHIAP